MFYVFYGVMPNLTIVLSDATIRRLRKAVGELHGAKKGALSGLVEQAVKDLLDRLEAPKPTETYRAVRDGQSVAEAETLESLARRLGAMSVDPRSVRILSSRLLKPVAKAGFRARAR